MIDYLVGVTFGLISGLCIGAYLMRLRCDRECEQRIDYLNKIERE